MEVVYKVDRLTRSLADFAKISITQAFNTTASMRRLSLNVLLASVASKARMEKAWT